ncbi:MAG: sugar ABC transporter ATP-binding protein [Candidatus Sumerlaeia bacterium]|nr:sugar ABC transporter ATP-binding protein [Candidatus Sumerlaeia bacterium]
MPSAPIILEAREITKTFPGVVALRNVSFAVAAGEVHAVIGENGAGKSTLMKVLSGVYPDYAGELLLDGKAVRFGGPREAQQAGIGIVHQELNLVRDLTAAENVFLGREPITRWGLIDRRRMNREAAELFARLDIDVAPDQRVGQLPVGQQQMVEIAKALSLNARVLILDEPTSALSDRETATLFSLIRRLREQGVGIVYISHRMEEVFQISDRITVLRDGEWVGTVPTAEASRDELIRMMVGRPLTSFFAEDERTTPDDRVVLSVENLSLAADVEGRRTRIQSVSFDVRAGEILGLAGLLGSGRTEVLEALFGAYGDRTQGCIRIDGQPVVIRSPLDAIQHSMALVTEDRKASGLVMQLSLRENLSLPSLRRLVRWGMVDGTAERRLVDEFIGRLSIRTPSREQPVANLSGGTQQKVILGKWLAMTPRILLLDEPTRGIDVGAKAEIYHLLRELSLRRVAVVMASSELPELLELCHRILVMREGRAAALFAREDATQEKILHAAAPGG